MDTPMKNLFLLVLMISFTAQAGSLKKVTFLKDKKVINSVYSEEEEIGFFISQARREGKEAVIEDAKEDDPQVVASEEIRSKKEARKALLEKLKAFDKSQITSVVKAREAIADIVELLKDQQ